MLEQQTEPLSGCCRSEVPVSSRGGETAVGCVISHKAFKSVVDTATGLLTDSERKEKPGSVAASDLMKSLMIKGLNYSYCYYNH